MVYGRNAVLSGQVINLRVVFTDDAGFPVSTDSLPDLYIYDESVDVDTVEAELAALTFTSALAGPLTATLITAGFYEYAYTVPPGSSEGSWHDVWVAAVDSTASNQVFAFTVDVGAELTTQLLLNNELILIELDSTIANVAGDKTLGEDTQLSFTTVYKPLYASPDLIRLELGPWIDYIPNGTLALMIYWASREADYLAKPSRCGADFKFARTKFVVYDAALKAVGLPGGSLFGGLGAGAGSKKMLGDLAIDKKGVGASLSTTSSGIDVDTLNYLRDQRAAWERVTNAGGCIVPGQSFDPTTAVRSRHDPDRRHSGRMWLNPGGYHYPQPSVNTKVTMPGRRRGRFGFGRRKKR